MSKKETTKIVKKKKENKKTESFLTGVKQEMVKYSVATLSFIIFFALFFTLGDLIVAGFKMLVG